MAQRAEINFWSRKMSQLFTERRSQCPLVPPRSRGDAARHAQPHTLPQSVAHAVKFVQAHGSLKREPHIAVIRALHMLSYGLACKKLAAEAIRPDRSSMRKQLLAPPQPHMRAPPGDLSRVAIWSEPDDDWLPCGRHLIGNWSPPDRRIQTAETGSRALELLGSPRRSPRRSSRRFRARRYSNCSQLRLGTCPGRCWSHILAGPRSADRRERGQCHRRLVACHHRLAECHRHLAQCHRRLVACRHRLTECHRHPGWAEPTPPGASRSAQQ